MNSTDIHAALNIVFDDALRLVGTAKIHREKMLSELGDSDPRVQRGNSFALGFAEGVAIGEAFALRKLGFAETADRIQYALDEMDPQCVARYDEVAPVREP